VAELPQLPDCVLVKVVALTWPEHTIAIKNMGNANHLQNR